MSYLAQSGPRWRDSQFGRDKEDTPSPGPPPGHARSKSSIMQSPLPTPVPVGHARNHSVSDLRMTGLKRNSSVRTSTPVGTFAPQFIQEAGLGGSEERVRGIEGENDFSGKRYVWVRDNEIAFVRGWVVEELPEEMLRVQCDDG
ncbi:class II myosin, partial [Friedmanniomyces endolithicus]